MYTYVREKLKEFRSTIGSHPTGFNLLFRHLKKYKGCVVEPDTEIVIEGAGGSGNSFAVVAFEFAQKRPVKIAHHTHVAGQVLLALKWNIPVLVLIRNPVDAVASLVSRHKYVSERFALKEYIKFYKKILPFRERFVLATFDEITTDYGAVIEKVNKKYKTNFKLFLHTEENVKACFDKLVLAKPTRENRYKKDLIKEKLKKSFSQTSLFKEAQNLYNLFVK